MWDDMPSAGVEQQDGRPSLNHHDLKHLFYILSYCGSVLYVKLSIKAAKFSFFVSLSDFQYRALVTFVTVFISRYLQDA